MDEIYNYNDVKKLFNVHDNNKIPKNISFLATNRESSPKQISLYNNKINLRYEFNSSYVATNFKLYNNENKLIFEVNNISNSEMIITDYIKNKNEILKSSAMNDITNVGLLYCNISNILYICVNYVCLGYQNYVYEINNYINIVI